MIRAALVLGLGLVACDETQGDGDDLVPGNTGDTGEVAGEDCPNGIDSSAPADGDTDVYYRTSIRVTLDDEDTTASLSLADAEGNPIDGTPTVSGDLVVFEPTEPLSPETSYVATLSYECEQDETISFTTSTTGNPTDGSVVGRVYDFDLRQGTFVKPEGDVGSLISGLIPPEVAVLLMASEVVEDDVNGDTISFIGAPRTAAGSNEQDPCAEPFEVTGATWEDPTFTGDLAVLPIDIQITVLNIVELELSGDYAADRSSIEIARLAGEIDTRELAGVQPLGDNPCVFFAGLGAECGPCSFEPSAEDCIEVEVRDLSLGYLEGAAPLVADPVCPG